MEEVGFEGVQLVVVEFIHIEEDNPWWCGIDVQCHACPHVPKSQHSNTCRPREEGWPVLAVYIPTLSVPVLSESFLLHFRHIEMALTTGGVTLCRSSNRNKPKLMMNG